MKPLKKLTTPSRRWMWYVILPILCALLIWIGDTLYHTARLYQEARQVQDLMKRGISHQTVREGIALVHSANEDYAAVALNLRPLEPLADWLGQIPVLGDTASQFHPLLSYIDGGLTAADLVAQSLDPILEKLSQGGQTTSPLETAIGQLQASQAKLDGATAALQEMEAARLLIKIDRLPARIGDLILRVDGRFRQAQGLLALLSQIPELAGTDTEQIYLLAAQNSDELRPTGGFISALGQLKIRSGNVLAFSMQDSFAADDFSKDYPYPPEPLLRFMLTEYWLPRDANWYPDFPTSARKLQDLYELSSGTKTDGVIAFDQSAVAALVAVLGPQKINGMSEPLTGANTAEWMRQAWSPAPGKGVDAAWWAQRKTFIGTVGKNLLAQIFSPKDEQKIFDVFAVGITLIRSGHLQVYLNRPQPQTALAQAGLDGSVRSQNGADFLMLVDANIGFNKVDAVIKRTIDYRLDLSNPIAPSAHFKASYTHPIRQTVECKHQAQYGDNYASLEQRCYWDYWRVLTSAQSVLQRSVSPAIPAEWLLNKQPWQGQVTAQINETGLTEFSGLLVAPTNATSSFELDWLLPSALLTRTPTGWSYRLQIQKQAGIPPLPVAIDLVPPSGCQLLNPGDWKAGNGSWSWSQKLEEGVILELEFHCP